MYNSTILALYRRPTIEFDPSDAEHRYWYYQFKKTLGWGNCPYTWHCPADYISVPDYIANLLAEYYMKQDRSAHKRPIKTGWLNVPAPSVHSPRRKTAVMDRGRKQ